MATRLEVFEARDLIAQFFDPHAIPEVDTQVYGRSTWDELIALLGEIPADIRPEDGSDKIVYVSETALKRDAHRLHTDPGGSVIEKGGGGGAGNAAIHEARYEAELRELFPHQRTVMLRTA